MSAWRDRRAGTAPALGAVLAAVLLLPAAVLNRAGPPPAMTGGFGEPTCHSCHFDNAEDRGSDSPERGLTLDGVPASYEAGRSYRLSVEVRHPELRRAGFEIAARFAAGADEARDAGTLQPVDNRTATTRFGSPPVTYLHHTDAGTRVDAAGLARWELEWQAPASALAPVVLHFVGNAANDDDSELGDHVFVRSVTIPPAGEKN